ncbi:ribose 5-phosphate isomerase B [Candidatus Peregrinibacteria bacterium CG10_big_fil_rev_8_21_14_0_10_36_19]|nr:MAG: ribose 5-phosphate isomerase B [Candidatus Peregrinibacteria bacterium CG10_big_fil_rev_8_21_14_0_10_36_19]
MEKVSVYMGADHAGFEVKGKLRDYLESEGYNVIDLGIFTDDPADYPDIAREVGEKVLEVKGSFGILLCGSGVGVCMAANHLKGIRAAFANTEDLADTSRRHNNANVLTLGARNTDFELIKKITIKFLTTAFEADQERHVRRVEKLDAL